MAFVQNVSLKEISALCDTLGLLLDRLMEPNSLAMVVGMTKKVIFTKLTSKILSEVELQHPLQKIIHNAAFLYTLETGDDSRVFLLLFKGIMKGIENMLSDSNEIEVRRTILEQISFFKSFIPDIFKNILNTNAVFSCINFGSPPKELEGLILTFFDSKFSANISKKLSNLIISFLSHSISNSSQAIDVLTYFISNFYSFCSKITAPLSESVILEGFLLHNKLPPIWKHKKMVNFVVILNLPCKSDEVIWEINGESFSEKFEHLYDNVNNALRQLKHLEISLILTEKGVSSNFESLCLQNGILIISRVPKEDIENILHLVNISAISNLQDSVDPQNIGYLQSLTSHVVGENSFTHLKVSVNKCAYLIPHHILLCAPLEEILQDYYSECLNCLKVVKQWIQPISKELFFHKEQILKSLKVQKHLENDCDQLLNYSKPNVTSESNIPTYVLGVAFPFTSFEFALKNILLQYKSEKLLFVKKLCDILDSALLTVLHKLWNKHKTIIVEEKDYLKFQKKMKCKIVAPIEPASNKENLLLRVLQLVEQLIKIDAIVSIK